MAPNFQEEIKLRKLGYGRIAGFDEAGRGPLAGPVIACAVVINSKFKNQKAFRGIKDSKQLSSKKREEFYKAITKNFLVEWAIGMVSEKVIDKINIFEATKLAAEKAIQKLRKKPDFLILDGNFKINLDIPQKPIIKADEKIFSCAAASIIAKVTRDRLMEKYHKIFPKYRFDKHKGYGTAFHLKMLKKYGPCKIHRKSFRPVIKFQN